MKRFEADRLSRFGTPSSVGKVILAIAVGFIPILWLSLLTQAQTFTQLYAFQGPPDGKQPFADLTRDDAGNLYGTTIYGGNTLTPCPRDGCGIVFKLDSAGQETVLYRFSGREDGLNPYAGLLRDAAGNLYGTTELGGRTHCAPGFPKMGCGVVFKLDPAGQLTVLHAFTGHPSDGAHPHFGKLVQDASGNIYGTTRKGGTHNYGTVFKLASDGTYAVLHSFVGTDGIHPRGNLVLDSAGNLYGVTSKGGRCGYKGGCGVIYKVDQAGNETVLHEFQVSREGYHPVGGLVQDENGNLYGTTIYGGRGPASGTIFELTPNRKEKVLYAFFTDSSGPYWPYAGVVRDSEGNLYGTTLRSEIGGYGGGTVYKLDPTGTLTVLHEFKVFLEGCPLTNLLWWNGSLYGTESFGGGYGQVYQVTP